MVDIVPGTGEHLAGVHSLLRAAGLPDRVGDRSDTTVFAAAADDRIVGGVALEVYGRYGLLRSLVVAEEWRGGGIGRRLTDAVVAGARRRELDALYLLTETAEAFFGDRGFREIARSEAPDEVRTSPEFSVLCPESAVAMALRL